MAEIVKMPKLSDTMTEGVVSKWHKKVGDTIKTGDLLADIETDKATMEFESFQDGVLLYVGVQEGKSAPVDSVLAILGKSGEDYSSLLSAAPAAAPVASQAPAPVSAPAPVAAPPAAVAQPASAPAASADGRLKVSPLARKMAEEKGIDINRISGSGDAGRIVKRDVENFAPSALAAYHHKGTEAFHTENVSQMRKTIARRLAESKFSAPHFYLTVEVLMDKAMEAREAINQVASSKVSYNDLVVKASAAALTLHPKINSSWLGDTIRYNSHVHIGVAVAVEEGLLVPVVKFANEKSLSQISSEVKAFGQKAKDKKLQPQDWEGNTFTISNLGMFGIDAFTAIINPPDACILAVGGIKQMPVVKDGQLAVGHVMKLTLSCDHRVVDGATGAAFLQTLRGFLENPVTLLA
jgi:pyruvate dehydrogenase E2 component (dihydrolipoamide acetyltransferase)